MSVVATLFRAPQPVPEDCQKNFRHLYGDVLWFGILNGSTLAFVAIFAARLGASVQTLGVLSAAPAIVNLVLALPAGQWLMKTRGSPVFWSAVAMRIFYAVLVPLPWIFNFPSQVTAVIMITFIMNVPGTALAIGFNALFGDVVPNEWRGYVVGVRNSILAASTVITTLVCGEILVRVPFPTGYQIVFGIGFLGAALSTYHLGFLKMRRYLGPLAIPEGGHPSTPLDKNTQTLTGRNRLFRLFGQLADRLQLRLDVMKGQFGTIIGLLFFFHLAQYLAIPLFSIYMVDNIHLSDSMISFGSAMFNVSLFIGSSQLARLTYRVGNKKTIGWGMVLISSFPAIMAISRGVELVVLANFISGFAWAMVGGALFNYLLELAPEDDRPAHMAWYNLALNAAILIGSLCGPLLAGWISIAAALFIFALFRLMAGISLLRWG